MRVEFVFRLLDGITFRTPLDAGCGNGYLAGRLAERAGIAWATDLSLSRLKDTARLFPAVRFSRASIFEQPFADRSFDLVTAVEVIEHLEDPERAVHELKRLSSRYLLITVPYRGTLQIHYCPHCNKSFYHDGHVQSFDEKRLAELLAEAGLKLLKLETYVPYYPPRGALKGLPRRVHSAVRGFLVTLRIKNPTRPKYLGALAERC
jgi:SAM-dependent methyltransferase